MFIIKALPAYDGDSFLISFGEGTEVKNIIVDGGRRRQVVSALKKEIADIKSKGQVIDLMILTHIDNDHIYGLMKLFEDDSINNEIIKEIWFNSKEIIGLELFNESKLSDSLKIIDKKNGNISYRQGLTFSKRLESLGIKNNKVITSGYSIKLGEANIVVVSPDKNQIKKLYYKWEEAFPETLKDGIKISSSNDSDYNCSISELLLKPYEEDTAIVNGSSIAFTLEYKGKKILMLADAHPSVVMANLKRIYGNEEKRIHMDLIKLSHHGSCRNINKVFVEKLYSQKYLISTNGKTHGLPNKETVVKIAKEGLKETTEEIKEKITFYFNYENVYNKMLTEDEIKELSITCNDKINNDLLVVDLWNSSES